VDGYPRTMGIMWVVFGSGNDISSKVRKDRLGSWEEILDGKCWS